MDSEIKMECENITDCSVNFVDTDSMCLFMSVKVPKGVNETEIYLTPLELITALYKIAERSY